MTEELCKSGEFIFNCNMCKKISSCLKNKPPELCEDIKFPQEAINEMKADQEDAQKYYDSLYSNKPADEEEQT